MRSILPAAPVKISELNKNLVSSAWEKFARRFWAKVQKTETCWLWTGPTFKGAEYGQIVPPGLRRGIGAHRVAWLLAHGEVPDGRAGKTGLVLMHLCDNPKCVRIEHLAIGTQLDNIRDMYAKGRNNPARGHRHRSARLTEPEVLNLRERYAAGGVTLRALAKEQSMSYAALRQAVNGITWKHLN